MKEGNCRMNRIVWLKKGMLYSVTCVYIDFYYISRVATMRNIPKVPIF